MLNMIILSSRWPMIPYAVYRASFPATFKEISASRGDYKKVVPYVLFGTAVGVVMAIFLSRTGELYEAVTL